MTHDAQLDRVLADRGRNDIHPTIKERRLIDKEHPENPRVHTEIGGAHDTATDVIFIGGRSGVGKSSVAAEVSEILARADIRHAIIEGDNLDQAHPQPWREGINLAEQNLAAMWKNYRAVGYSRLIFTNTVSVLQIAELTAALGGETRASAVLLTATDATAAHRLAQQETGTALVEHIDRSNRAARRLDAADDAVLRVATDGRSVAEIAHEVLVEAGWLGTETPR